MADQLDKVKQLIQAFSQKGSSPGGLTALVQMLNQLDRKTEKHILATLKQQNPKLADELSDIYFTFEDLVNLNDSVLKKALLEVHRATLALALKGTAEPIRLKVFQNLSERTVRMIRDDMELMGPKPVSLIEAAQREVTTVLRRWRNVIL
jgi:flagellar motor switch protein FliG